jgi:hypothetical protein
MRRNVVAKGTPGARPFAVRASYPTGPAGGYTPADLASAYDFNPAVATTGQTVAIVDAYNDPDARADLSHFDANYGLPAETTSSLSIVGQTGTAALPSNDTTGWNVEESLDLDSVRGVCHTCKIILVETNSSSDSDLAAGVKSAVGLGATEVSNSYGGVEDSSMTAAQAAAYEAEYTYPGVVVTASTGDDGWYEFDQVNEGNYFDGDAPELPASLPTVVSVGGTTLNLTPSGTRSSETVWNRNGKDDETGWDDGFAFGAGGGGCSTVYNAQGWQHSVSGFAATGCKAKRLNADVSAIADPYTGYDIYDSDTAGGGPGGWATYGGTSLASPVVSAMWALAGGSGGVKYPALSLYGHLQTTPSSFYDVTSGSNAFCNGDSPAGCAANGPFAPYDSANPNQAGAGDVDCSFPGDDVSGTTPISNRQCRAFTGYDGPSGVGTPNGLTGFTAMSPTTTLTPPATLTHGSPATFTSTATDPFPGGKITSWTWIFGDGSSTVTTATGSASHTYAAAGHYTVHATAHDNYGRAGSMIVKVTVG